MSDESRAAAERARARANWPGQVTTFDDQDDATLVRHGTPGERVCMVWRITQDAWASAGLEIPQYTRSEIPSRIIRPDR